MYMGVIDRVMKPNGKLHDALIMNMGTEFFGMPKHCQHMAKVVISTMWLCVASDQVVPYKSVSIGIDAYDCPSDLVATFTALLTFPESFHNIW